MRKPESPDPMQERLVKRISEVTAAFDRDVRRRRLMKEKLAGADAIVLLAAIDSLDSPERAALWLTSPEPVLGNACPLDVAATAEGRERVLRLLWSGNLGAFAPA
jgi:uncharacterized protein (DUF2384 family)